MYGADKCDGTVKAPAVSAFPAAALSSFLTVVAVDREDDGLNVVTIKRPHRCPGAKVRHKNALLIIFTSLIAGND